MPGAPPTPVPGAAVAAPGPVAAATGVPVTAGAAPGVPVPEVTGAGDAGVAAAAAAPLVPLVTLHLEIIRGICCKWS